MVVQKSKAIKRFIQLMLDFPESYTGGSLVCELYPNSTLLTWIISIWGTKAESVIESRWLLLL